MTQQYWEMPEPSLDPPEYEDRVAAECSICGDDILYGDTCMEIPRMDTCICMRCWNKFKEVTLD